MIAAMHIRLGIALVLLVGLLGSCRQQDIRTVTIRIPGAKQESCRAIVKAALTKLDGVQADSITFEVGAVTVTYDSMKLARKNIEYGIAAAGFDANDIPAYPAAREALPPECK